MCPNGSWQVLTTSTDFLFDYFTSLSFLLLVGAASDSPTALRGRSCPWDGQRSVSILPPVLSFYQSHPASHPNPTAKKGKRLARALFISLVKSSFGSLKTKEMDKKRGGLMQRAMPPKPTEGSRIRPIASTYNVMITLVYPSFFGSLTYGRPSNKKRYKYGNFSAIWIGEFMEEIGF